jgi:hypothetical protein
MAVCARSPGRHLDALVLPYYTLLSQRNALIARAPSFHMALVCDQGYPASPEAQPLLAKCLEKASRLFAHHLGTITYGFARNSRLSAGWTGIKASRTV